MQLINREYNAFQDQYTNTWLANEATAIAPDFDADCAEGSMIIVISTKDVYIKNCNGRWQKFGTTEVI